MPGGSSTSKPAWAEYLEGYSAHAGFFLIPSVKEDPMRHHVLLGQARHYRHRYQCWACRYAGVLEFEPDASEAGWTECHYCGIDNEIPPGLYDRPALIPGQVPSRII
jgi:hypothetical protein